jgi:hypothetical protein
MSGICANRPFDQSPILSIPEGRQGVREMKYRKLGNTGLIVSEVALGTMQFGGKMNMGNLGQEDTTRMVKLALDGIVTSTVFIGQYLPIGRGRFQ